jgi:hypothetical protein
MPGGSAIYRMQMDCFQPFAAQLDDWPYTKGEQECADAEVPTEQNADEQGGTLNSAAY